MLSGELTRLPRGRPCKDQVDELRDSILRTAIGATMLSAHLDSIAIAVLQGKRLTRSRLSHLSKTYLFLKEPCQWPLELLRTSALKRSDLEHLIAPYFVRSSCVRTISLTENAGPACPREPGHLPSADVSIGELDAVGYRLPSSGKEPHFYSARSTGALVQRGDVYGFLGCLMSYRIACWAGDINLQWVAGRALVRALPGACIHPFIRPEAEPLIDLTCSVLSLMPSIAFPIDVDRDVVNSLVRAGQPYIEGVTDDPLFTYRLVRCAPGEAGLVLGSGKR